jgi:hypothetical protein
MPNDPIVQYCEPSYSLDPYDKCGPECIAEPPLLDTADGNEHQECPE